MGADTLQGPRNGSWQPPGTQKREYFYLLLLLSANLHPSLTPAFAQVQASKPGSKRGKGRPVGGATRVTTGPKRPKYAPYTFPKWQGSLLDKTVFDHFWAQNSPFGGPWWRHFAPPGDSRGRVEGGLNGAPATYSSVRNGEQENVQGVRG